MDTITYIVILGLCFLVIDWLSYGGVGEGVYGRSRSRLWKKLGRIETRGLAVLENWTISWTHMFIMLNFFVAVTVLALSYFLQRQMLDQFSLKFN